MKEVATSETDVAEAEASPPERVERPPAPAAKPKAKAPAPAEPPGPAAERLGPDLRAVRASEDLSLRELLDGIGTEGSYRIRVTRKMPVDCKDPATGRLVTTAGFLKMYESNIDETTIKQAHGGGTYELKINRKTPAGGFQYFAQRTMNIAGDPDLDDPCLTRVPTPSGPPPPPVAPATVALSSESPTVVGKAMDIMASQIERMSEDRHDGRRSEEMSPAVTQMMQMMQGTMDRMQAELAEARRASVTKPVEDPFKENLLNNLMRDDNSRLSSVRAQYESEIRVVKENAQAEQRRLEERHERYQSEARSSHEREIANIRQAHEVTLASVRASYEMQNKMLEGDLRRLERDNGEMRVEVKELRAKHGKSIVEQAKDLNDVKEALGLGGDEEQSTVDKVVGALSSPAALGVVERFMAGRAPAAAVPAQQVPAGPRLPKTVATPDGKKFRMMPDGKMIPLRPKPKVITATVTNPDGTAGPTLTLPVIPEETSKQVTGLLERAFAGNQDPVIVAQSARAHVPDEIMAVIREHGVDVYLQKVARLPSGSPLSTQAGKNWVRKVGEALVE